MAKLAKRMGRPPGEPSRVVRLPLPVAALAKRLADKTLRAGDINAFFDIAPRRTAAVPLMASPAACGFPSPADDYLDRPIEPMVAGGPGSPERQRFTTRRGRQAPGCGRPFGRRSPEWSVTD